jgi:hypothetical protein
MRPRPQSPARRDERRSTRRWPRTLPRICRRSASTGPCRQHVRAARRPRDARRDDRRSRPLAVRLDLVDGAPQDASARTPRSCARSRRGRTHAHRAQRRSVGRCSRALTFIHLRPTCTYRWPRCLPGEWSWRKRSTLGFNADIGVIGTVVYARRPHGAAHIMERGEAPIQALLHGVALQGVEPSLLLRRD